MKAATGAGDLGARDRTQEKAEKSPRARIFHLVPSVAARGPGGGGGGGPARAIRTWLFGGLRGDL